MMHGKTDAKPAGLKARAFLVPIAWIAALVVGYLVLADWQTLPSMVGSAVAGI